MNTSHINAYADVLKIKNKDVHYYKHSLTYAARNAFLLNIEQYRYYQQRVQTLTKKDFLQQFQQFIEHFKKFTEHKKFKKQLYKTKPANLNKWPSLLEYASTCLNKPKKAINGKDLYQIYLEIRNFIQTIVTFQNPNKCLSLFTNKNTPTNEIKIPLNQRFLPEQPREVHKTHIFLGIYSQQEMERHLERLQNIATIRCAMILSTEKHAVMLAYDTELKQWILNNKKSEKNIAAIYTNDTSTLIQALWDDFDAYNKQNLVLDTSIYTLGNTQETTLIQATFDQAMYEKVESYDRSTLLFLAADHGYENVLQILLEHGYKKDIKNNREILLHKAMKHGHEKVVRILLEHGCKKDIKNDDGDTSPLRMAILYGYENVVRILLEHGCKKNIKDNHGGDTALHSATWHDHENMVRILLKHGCKTDIKNDDGNTALHVAIRYGHENHENIVQTLLKHGCKTDIKNNEGDTALHLAIRDGYENVVRMLLEHGCKTDIKNNAGDIALHIAARRCFRGAVQTLLEHGCKTDTKDNEGNTALHLAINGWYHDVARILLEYGCKLDIKNNEGDTALHIATSYGHENMIQTLLGYGCKKDIKNNKGDTALHLATRGYEKVVRTLLRHGCKADIKNNKDNTALHLAINHKRKDIAQSLVTNSLISKIEKYSNALSNQWIQNDIAKKKSESLMKIVTTYKASTSDGQILSEAQIVSIRDAIHQEKEILRQHRHWPNCFFTFFKESTLESRVTSHQKVTALDNYLNHLIENTNQKASPVFAGT